MNNDTLPLLKNGFTCLGTHIGSADFRSVCFRKTERKTRDLLERMRPLTDNKLHTLSSPTMSHPNSYTPHAHSSPTTSASPTFNS